THTRILRNHRLPGQAKRARQTAAKKLRSAAALQRNRYQFTIVRPENQIGVTTPEVQQIRMKSDREPYAALSGLKYVRSSDREKRELTPFGASDVSLDKICQRSRVNKLPGILRTRSLS